MGDAFRVVVAGGGVAGLEAVLALRDLPADDSGFIAADRHVMH